MVRPTLSRAINRPRLVFGAEKWTLLFASAVLLICMFVLTANNGFWYSLLWSVGVAYAICQISSLYTRRDPKFFSVKIRAFRHAAVYDPGKFQPFVVEIKK